jgi:transposase
MEAFFMMGKPNQLEPKLFYHGVSLDRRIPKDHPLRKIEQLIDFNFIRSKVADRYGTRGNESVDPAVILKLMFLLFFENIKSERALMSQLPLRLDWLWFCGYDLDEKTPDHSVISKARRRWGLEVFTMFFGNILTQCVDAGLVDGETIHIDSSMIDANASHDSLTCQFRAFSHGLYEELEGNAEPIPQKLEKRISTTDPDARLGRKYGKNTLGYKDHRAVDDKHGIVTTTVTTPANVNDEKVFAEVITKHQANTNIKVKTSVADKAYGTGENYKYLHEQGITPCIYRRRKNCNRETAFSNDKFSYDEERDVYICPTGNQLKFSQFKHAKNAFVYIAKRKTCQQCLHFKECVTGKNSGRQMQRNANEEHIKWADNCLSKGERKRLMARRKHKAEGSFADAANNHGFKRSRFRGIEKVQMQNLMIAAIQNLRKLMHHITRKPAMQASKLASTLRLSAGFHALRPSLQSIIVFQP